ncbi:hypothetical protein [Saccharopolyspora mangrovi]|uniref:Methyl-accepting chemotaxis protein n=1 Tax=Saccharopolyspora mangrovi TaxID=3082379 RepID=A0ABU6AIS6_9PSEU|nr:hypothetical protein [Saccharopolyspora sp. S2-29]MEB3371353.1 hypothetical protein [Saccharopolyspora sp. S2-29]
MAAIFSLPMLTGILVVTRDLAVTNDIFKDGVGQAEEVVATTGKALGAADQLPSADAATGQSLPEVVGALNSLSKAQTTLGALGGQLDTLGTVLTRADSHLVSIVEATRTSTEQAGAAAKPLEGIVGPLADSDEKVRCLAGMLDETSARAQRIESKLRILLVLPELSR